MDADRSAREREYHNARVEHEIRDAQGKYYAAIKHGSFDSTIGSLMAGADVLEYGCGNLPVLLSLPPTYRSATGIDISDLAIASSAKRAAQLGLQNLEFRQMDAEQMSFPDNSFDLIFGRGIIHHLDVEQSFAEIARVLRPSGRAVFWEPLGHNLALNLYRRLTPHARTPDEHPLLRTDFDLARRYFQGTSLSFFGLTTLLSVPFRDTRVGDAILRLTARMDRCLFHLPGLKWQAWYCQMILVR